MISEVFIGDIAIEHPFPETSQIRYSTDLETLSMRGDVRRCAYRLVQTQRRRRYGSRMPASMRACSKRPESFRVCATWWRYVRFRVGACTFTTPADHSTDRLRLPHSPDTTRGPSGLHLRETQSIGAGIPLSVKAAAPSATPKN